MLERPSLTQREQGEPVSSCQLPLPLTDRGVQHLLLHELQGLLDDSLTVSL
jgi:hypothetical protein